MHTSVVPNNPLDHPSTNAALPLYLHLQTSYPPSDQSLTPTSTSYQPSYASPPSSTPGLAPSFLLSLPILTRSGLPNGTQEVFLPVVLNFFTFFCSFPSILLCQEIQTNSSQSFRIPGYSAMPPDCTHSRFGTPSPDDSCSRGSVMIFVTKGLSFSQLS